MPVTASDKGGSDFQLAPEGNHLAICVQVIDLGTQNEEYMGKPKQTRKVRIAWELPEEKAVFDDSKGEESFMVSKEYTLSLNEKANLRHDLESWRGKAFTDEELAGFDIAKLLGAPGMVNAVHATSVASKRQYVKITSVTRLPKNIKLSDVPKATLPIVEYSIDDGRNNTFELLPEFIRKKILASEEVKKALDGSTPEPKSAPDDDDDIPF